MPPKLVTCSVWICSSRPLTAAFLCSRVLWPWIPLSLVLCAPCVCVLFLLSLPSPSRFSGDSWASCTALVNKHLATVFHEPWNHQPAWASAPPTSALAVPHPSGYDLWLQELAELVSIPTWRHHIVIMAINFILAFLFLKTKHFLLTNRLPSSAWPAFLVYPSRLSPCLPLSGPFLFSQFLIVQQTAPHL